MSDSTISDELLEMLRCPEDHSALVRADDFLVAQLNEAIEAKRLVNLAGRTVENRIDGGLVREAGDLLYPVLDQIPVMLHDEAIPLDQVGH